MLLEQLVLAINGGFKLLKKIIGFTSFCRSYAVISLVSDFLSRPNLWDLNCDTITYVVNTKLEGDVRYCLGTL